MFKRLLLKLIVWYQENLSLDHGKRGKKYPNYRVCRFYPSCSEYSYTAIKRFGVIKGGGMSIKRIVKCNPMTPMGTYDPVPERKN
jgi:putative membrane protein insertion efficiency factor